MKVTYPLSLKISVWLLLNLALLAVAGGAFYWWQFGRGWDSLAVGAVGERYQAVGDRIVGTLYDARPAERAALLAERARAAGLALHLFRNDGTVLVGPPVELPPAFAEHLLRGSQRPGPPPGKGGFRERGRAAAGEDTPALKRGPPGSPRSGGGRFVVRAGDPPETWLGLRVPFPRDDGPPIAATLVVRSDSLFALFRLLDVAPWLGLAAGVFVVSVLFWLPLVAGIARALRRLTAATEAIAEGRFDTRVPASRRDELGQLGHSVNRMAARLDTLVNGQKRFLGDVAHELGSPLGRLQVATEILETRADPSLRPHVADVRDEVEQMAALVQELLAFTKAGLRPRDADLAPVDVDALLAGVLAREDPAARVDRPDPTGFQVMADGPLLARAVGNLVRNALRYAGDGAAIFVTLARDGAHVVLAVEDRGPGVPQEALARLGEPFYRPESARTREAGGAGLGLAIVRSATAACGGEVRFAHAVPHGFRAELRLAAAPAA